MAPCFGESSLSPLALTVALHTVPRNASKQGTSSSGQVCCLYPTVFAHVVLASFLPGSNLHFSGIMHTLRNGFVLFSLRFSSLYSRCWALCISSYLIYSLLARPFASFFFFSCHVITVWEWRAELEWGLSTLLTFVHLAGTC